MQPTANPRVLLSTSLGDITLELDGVKAPVSTDNFLDYVTSGHFDGTIFHRVIPGFMIQGGGFTADMAQKPTSAPIANEADNGMQERPRHRRHGPDLRPQQRHQPVLHQRRGQRLSQPHGQDRCRVGAMRCSARWSTGSTWSTRSSQVPTGNKGRIPTCPGARDHRQGHGPGVASGRRSGSHRD